MQQLEILRCIYSPTNKAILIGGLKQKSALTFLPSSALSVKEKINHSTRELDELKGQVDHSPYTGSSLLSPHMKDGALVASVWSLT